MKIAVIGNGEQTGPYLAAPHFYEWHNPSEEIDNCDWVVRCNRARFYYDGWTGWRCDQLIVRSASGIHGRRICTNYDFTIPDGVLVKLQKLTVVGEKVDTPNQAIEPYLIRYPELKNRQIEYVPWDKQEKLTEEIKMNDGDIPTLGLLAITYILDKYPGCEINLAGFPFKDKQCRPHDWDAEELWVRNHKQIKDLETRNFKPT